MTRINCIPVEELHDKHLLAEYRELPRVFRLARECPDAPKRYTLGAGHVKFFYNKLSWLLDRYGELWHEMKRRGFEPKYSSDSLQKLWSPDKALLWGTWRPTPEAQRINRARIAERLEKMRTK